MRTRTLRLGIALLCCVIFSSCSPKEKMLGLGENIHHDDFEYSVQGIGKSDQIGGLRAHGTFLIVTFQVENRAKQVNHRWANDIAFVIDDSGNEYENRADAQKELNRTVPFNYKTEYLTPAGATDTTMLVFDVPRDAKQPALKVRGSLLMGDLFDGDQYRRTRVRLF